MAPAPRHIAVLVGSLRRDSLNRRLAEAVQALAPDCWSFTRLEIGELPPYNQDQDAHQPEAVLRLKQDIRAADGLLFVTPEYNRSIPGVLKNAIDHASRPAGLNAWAGKPAGLMGASVGAIGTAVAQQQMRGVLAYLDVPTLGQPEVYIHAKAGVLDEDGSLGADTRDFLQKWMDRYVTWIERHLQRAE